MHPNPIKSITSRLPCSQWKNDQSWFERPPCRLKTRKANRKVVGRLGFCAGPRIGAARSIFSSDFRSLGAKLLQRGRLKFQSTAGIREKLGFLQKRKDRYHTHTQRERERERDIRQRTHRHKKNEKPKKKGSEESRMSTGTRRTRFRCWTSSGKRRRDQRHSRQQRALAPTRLRRVQAKYNLI